MIKKIKSFWVDSFIDPKPIYIDIKDKKKIRLYNARALVTFLLQVAIVIFLIVEIVLRVV